MINSTVRGNVGNVDLKNMPNGDPVLEISIASNDRGKGGVEVCTWVRATVFGKRAEALSRVVKKGDSLLNATKGKKERVGRMMMMHAKVPGSG